MTVYLDNAATSYPKPEEVYHAIDSYLRQVGASPGRGTYRQALRAEDMVNEVRKLLSQLFSISEPSRIIFTANVTESLNMALKGYLEQGDHVITSHLEHNAVWRPLKTLEKERDIRITTVPNPKGCQMDLRLFENSITTKTRMAVINHASNVTGTLMPLKEIGRICSQNDIVLLVDAAQTAGAYPIDVNESNISLLAFTGHKSLLGPTGTGGLFIKKGTELKPFKEGGTGGDSLLESQPPHLPDRFEAGTINAAGIVGLGEGVRYILERGIEKIREHEEKLTAIMLDELEQIQGIVIYGPREPKARMPVISFNLEDVPPEDVAYVLDEVYDIMVRAGLHCSPQAHRTIGTEKMGAVRASIGCFTTEEEVREFCKAVREIGDRSRA